MNQKFIKAYSVACHTLVLSVEVHHVAARAVTTQSNRRHGKYSNPHCTCTPRVKNKVIVFA